MSWHFLTNHYPILIFTFFDNKVCRGIAYFHTKMSYLSDFKRIKSKTLRTASTGRMTNWKKPPRDPVQIIRTKGWYFKSLIIVNTATSYSFTNVHVIYFWNGQRERLLAIDINNFIRAQQNDIDGAVLICIAMKSCSH